MDLICGECKRITEVVCDHASGDTLCSECGLVLESRSIDESNEWRNFANDNNNNDNDPNRVGKATNPLLDNTYLTTFIVNTNGEQKDPKNFISCDSTTLDKSYHQLVIAFAKLGNMVDHLGLVDTIRDRGCELFKKIFHVNKQKACRGRNINAILGACLLVACQQKNLPRTVKEICSLINDENATKKEVMRVKSFIMKQLVNFGGDGDGDGAVEGIGRTIRAGDLVRRFCSNLGISNNRVMKAALETAIKCEDEVDLRRSPISVAAAVVYMVIQLNGDEKKAQARLRRSLKEIATVMKVGESTLRNTYKDLYPYATKIVPSWYVNPDTIEDLLCPPSFGGHGWLVN
ncbi:transcription initiation factor IIB-2-like [Silene latifolia]|uniref:transcription initiation factor IIB-2-like n=1 Tax=Silene latifolia TaxID=37657 RepID=UPI003D76F1A9